MKSFTTLFIATFTGLAANAGAYDFSCSNSSGTLVLGKSQATLSGPLNSPEYGSGSEGQPTHNVEYVSKSLGWGASEQNLEFAKIALRIETVGKIVILKKTNLSDQCGNVGSKTVFTANVRISRLINGKRVLTETILCEDQSMTGHDCDLEKP